ncbi:MULTISPECIES: TnsA endonuclease N-terminal domain-containing protein [Gammaproteobacteria]|uniref:TnsA endonuclease N-terminal domain-containing protein n=1 Tax=Gammaproteobacteria TaxID=1236 RepID=UPI000746262E|nr:MULTISPECIES: TnsA endonuclease N-terminal domain-containing protein [Gammaproteobacteria]EKI2248623.1 heteromeric transposase endonuclease subunit TnsA [Salmonella enterica subsp. enterica serovar Schwarzengrund]ELL8668568.1 heteromeric transposase endonuclease subunit TnsA [Citrobacter freundii]HBQ3690922.1 heteromeric transposase endonuclease subunit TnsA [Salmonella enterica subsp. enterica serovar Senftenberg]HBZ8454019.1 heteromeric transposase endonuclease subunit TnsA [Escherichia co
MTSLSLDSRSLKWVKQGRGKGSGKDYQPWLTVRDLPSAGRSHRIWGFQTQRTHHLLSDLELAAFFLFDWNPSVTDIREQYPLRLEDTIELAAQARIRHPEVRGQIQVMSTDFLVDTNKPELPRMAIQVKTSSDLSNSRTIEKLELERRYWALKEVPWYLLTEKQIPKTVTKNIAWLYPAQLVLDGIEDTLNMASLYLGFFINHPTLLISQVSMMLDQAYSLSPGESLQKIRSLLALRVFLFDIRKPWSTLAVGELQASSDIDSLRNYYVANQ